MMWEEVQGELQCKNWAVLVERMVSLLLDFAVGYAFKMLSLLKESNQIRVNS